MVEATINLRNSFIATPVPTNDVKLPSIFCAGRMIELHGNNKISIIVEDKTHWMHSRTTFNKFLDKHFSQIDKIEILKIIFHGLHTEERKEAIRFISLLKKN